MAPFFGKEHHEELDRLHHRLTNSFANVKDDISVLKRNEIVYQQWINYMHQKILAQERDIKILITRLHEMPQSHADIKKIIDEHYKFEDILKRVEQLNRQVDEVLQQHNPIIQKLGEHHKRLDELEQVRFEKRPHFREKIVQKITKNSKDYVKGLIVSLARKYERISAIQLREIVVEEQGLCSKSSFYRLLEEVEESGDFDVVQDGKEKYYLSRRLALRKQTKE